MGKIKVCPKCKTLKGSCSKESRYCKCEKEQFKNK